MQQISLFYESNDGEAIIGHEAINNLINKLQAQWPLDFKFELAEPGRSNHDIQQISWRLGVPGQPAVATGMDVAMIADNKIKGLYLLMDAPAN
ncbi:hypothetical protein [Mucilaginibacter auburnensis]|uniref:hypothetical protein n=1 Tax=Mucilaginibacter auburnensis TaxID=1457233 RepID=UPI000C24B52E|nr:hypothetical protein [Mucilaginibacter auburnensis]